MRVFAAAASTPPRAWAIQLRGSAVSVDGQHGCLHDGVGLDDPPLGVAARPVAVLDGLPDVVEQLAVSAGLVHESALGVV